MKKLPRPRSYHIPGILTECLVTFSAANLGLTSYWNLSDLNFQLLALLFLSPCDWRAFHTLYFLPGKVLTHCNQLNLNLLFDELSRSRIFSLSLQGWFSSSSTGFFCGSFLHCLPLAQLRSSHFPALIFLPKSFAHNSLETWKISLSEVLSMCVCVCVSLAKLMLQKMT